MIRQLLTESLLLAILGGAAGWCWGSGPSTLCWPSHLRTPRLQEVAFDRSVFLFAAGLTLTTGLLFGLIRAAVVPSDIAQPLKDGVRRVTAGGRGVRRALVILEVALR